MRRAGVLVVALLWVGCSGEKGSGNMNIDVEPVGYMEECVLEADNPCIEEGDVCFNFNSKGPLCTRECTEAADCAAPSPGCNGMGVCKAPGGGTGDGSGGGMAN